MKKLSLCAFCTIFVFFCFVSCFAGGNNNINHEKEEKKLRIVSLAPNVTEIICALGAEDCLVGRTTYCNYPESVLNIQDVGDLYSPNLELITGLMPDAVIASSIVGNEELETLEKAGIKTFQFFHEDMGLDGVYLLTEEIGEVLGKQEEADILIQNLKTREKVITDKTQHIENKKKSILFVSWGSWGDYVATGDTYINDVLSKAGTENIAQKCMYWSISKEMIIAENPEAVFITENSNYVNSDIVEAFKSTPPYSMLCASENNNVYSINDDLATRLSPRLIDVLEYITYTVYPELI